MITRTWIRRLFARTARTNRKAPHRPALELLEDRVVPSVTPPGYYSATGQGPGIAASPGTYVAVSGSTAPTLDPIGYYTDQPASVAPIAAPPGSYVGTTGATAPTPDPIGTFTNQAGSAAPIAAPPGSFVSSFGATSATLDPLGTYTNQSGAALPIPAPAGSYVGTVGATAPTLDPVGTYTNMEGSTAPILAPPGYFVGTVGATSPTLDPVGTYTDQPGATAPTPAPAGSYVPTTGATAPILASPGYYVPVAGAAAETPADAGYYVPFAGATQEIPDPPGTTSGPAATAPTPVTSSPTPPGYYSATGQGPGIAASPGTYVAVYGATSATLDPAGYYTDQAGSTAPIPAPAGFYVATAGATQATIDPLGAYTDQPGSTAPVPAPPGYFVATLGASAPTLDPVGTYTNLPGSIEPISAPPGSYVATTGATSATIDPPGTYTNQAGSAAPIPAPVGFYVGTAGAVSATPAPAGTYTDQTGLAAPIAAPPGYFVAFTGAAAPTIDPLGTYTNQGGSTAAILAPPGFFVATLGATEPTLAPPGYYVPDAGASQAIPAAPGFYVPTAGATQEIADPPGTTSGIAATAPTAASLVVTTAADVVNPFDGVTSLREAIDYANTLSGPQTITFDPSLFTNGPVTISLSESDDFLVSPAAFGITGSLTIQGPATANGNGLTISVAFSASPMRLFDVYSGASLTLDDLELTGGVAQGDFATFGLGGAVYDQGSLTVQSCTIDGCSAIGGDGTPGSIGAGDGRGGAIYGDDGSSVVINDSTLSSNSVAGGPIGLFPGQGLGGAVFTQNGSLTILDSTLAYNSAPDGGGAVYVQDDGDFNPTTATVQMNNTIAADSTGSVSDFVASALDGGTVTTGGNNNLIYNNPDSASGGFVGTGTISNQDPKLGKLMQNGGPTPTIAISLTSPAVGAADAALSEATDQRGLPRDSSPDIGAYENEAPLQLNVLGTLIPAGNPLLTSYNQAVTDVSNRDISDAVTALNTFTGTAVEDLTNPNSGVSLNGNFIPMMTEVGRVTIALGETVFQAPTLVASYISNLEAMAFTIPGGLTGGNALVQPWVNAVTALVEQNFPTVVGSLNSFTSTAVGEATTAGSGVILNGNNANLVPLVTDVAELTKALGVTPVVVPPAIYNQYIGDFTNMAIAIPGGLTSGNALAAPWEQAVIGLVEQNFPSTFGALRSFINTSVSQAATVNLASLTALESPTIALENALGIPTPVLTVTPSLTSPTYGQSLSFTVVVNPGGTAPSGTVQFSVDGVALGSPVSIVNGQAVSSGISTLSAATHIYSAVFTATTSPAVTVQSANLSITPKALSVSIINDPSKPYNGKTDATLSSTNFSLSGLVSGDNFTVTQTTGTYNSAHVLTATSVTANLSAGNFTPVGGTQASNYLFPTSASGPGQITTAAFTYQIPNDTQLFGIPANLAHDLGTTINTNVNGENLSVTYSSLGDTATAVAGNYSITGTASNGTGLLSDYTPNLKPGILTVGAAARSVYLLNPNASGALTASGNADVVLPGGLYVDSNSSSAILASGNAKVNVGGTVLVVGGVSKSGNASVTRTGTPAATNDPLAGLPLPAVTDSNGNPLPSYGAVSVSGNTTKTLQPGIYTSIQVSGNAQVTLSNSGTGIYIIKGGGLSVSGNASLSGSGVMIFNAGSTYNGTTDSGTEGSITLGGNGTITLSGPTSGQYTGIVIFQPASNTKALSLSGNGSAGITTTIYAPAAAVGLSGNAELTGSLIASTLSVSGNAGAFQLADGNSSDYVASTANWITNTVLTVAVVDDTGAGIDPSELDRISDAMSYLNAALGSFGVNLSWADSGSVADVTIHFASTTPEGSAADGVLGFTTPDNNVYLVEGWNFYTGADPTQVSAGQYDFQTLAEHELAHTVGLGESSDPGSVMYEYLAPGVARRTFTDANLTAINTVTDRFMKVEPSVGEGPSAAVVQALASLTPTANSLAAPVLPIASAGQALPDATSSVIPSSSGTNALGGGIGVAAADPVATDLVLSLWSSGELDLTARPIGDQG